MRLGYNTNGLAHHDLLQAIELLADLGYRSVAITLDHGSLNPYSDQLPQQIQAVRRALSRHGLRSVIETGARFLLDPRVKHEPTLMTADPARRAQRIDFLCRALDIAAELSSDCLSCWSGILRDNVPHEIARQRLVAGLEAVMAHAEKRAVPVGFEPEPGMFIATMADLERLLPDCDSPWFKLTLDVGHLHCQSEWPIEQHIVRWRDRLVNVHVEDMRRGVHEHLMFGEGEMQFPPILDAFCRADYRGGVHVELSRHSHDGPGAAQRAYQFLAPLANWG